MKVLLVEDDPSLRKFLEDSLSLTGYEVKVAEDGRAGLEAFLSFSPDLVMTDIKMPRMDGLELLSEIRKRSQEVIVIVMTAYGCEEYALEALHRLANNYLTKPIRFEDLIRLLKKYASILKHRQLPKKPLGLVVRRELTIVFDNRIHCVPQMANRLVLEIGKVIPKENQLGIHLGLAELLANAIEHGNLGITYEEKTAALEEDRIDQLYQDRLADLERAKKKVTVHFKMTPASCEWFIEDQGLGFEWKGLPTAIDERNFLELHGRGIFLSRIQFDEFEFLGKGNLVRVKRLIPSVSAM